MVGTVFHQELLLGSRRNRLHVFRWAYAAWLVLQVCWFFLQFQAEEQGRRLTAWQARGFQGAMPGQMASAPAVVGIRFAEAFIVQQLVLLAIAAPALVAGAITDEKRRGTLQYLLLADLGTRQLLLGKLAGRLAQVALLALAGLPLFGLLAGFGGVEPLTLLVVAALFVAPAFALAAASLLASVWCRQTRDAVLALYVACLAGAVLVWRMGSALAMFNPLWVLEAGWGPTRGIDANEVAIRLTTSTLAWGALGGVCLALAGWRLKPTYLRELEGRAPKSPQWYGGQRAPMDDDPVRWRERHVEGLAPAHGLRRVPTWLGVAAVALASLVSSVLVLTWAASPNTSWADVVAAFVQLNFTRLEVLLPDAADGFLIQGLSAMLLGSLVVGIRCSGAVTGERERQTWEALLLTPLSARDVIRGKLWGVMGASYRYLLAYAFPAILASMLGGLMATVWTLLWLAVTVLAMYFVGAAALWSSARSQSSWQALLKTLAWGYAGGALMYALSSFPALILALLLVLFLAVADAALGTTLARTIMNNWSLTVRVFLVACCISLAGAFLLTARLFLSWAQRHVAERERTRHWQEEPVYRKSRRKPSTRG